MHSAGSASCVKHTNDNEYIFSQVNFCINILRTCTFSWAHNRELHNWITWSCDFPIYYYCIHISNCQSHREYFLGFLQLYLKDMLWSKEHVNPTLYTQVVWAVRRMWLNTCMLNYPIITNLESLHRSIWENVWSYL